MVVKNEITAENIQSVQIAVEEPLLTLKINAPGVAAQRTYLCENKVIRNQILGEIFEICYYNKPEKSYKFVGCCVKLAKDSIIKIKDDKIVWDFHYARTQIEFGTQKLKITFEQDVLFVDELVVLDMRDATLLIDDFKKLSGYKEENEPDLE